MKTKEVMVHDPRFCTPASTLADAGAIMSDGDCGALPVVGDAGKVVGIITDRDICLALARLDRRASEIYVREVTSGKVHSCRPEDELRHALKIMQIQRVRRLPVLDADGKLQGMLSMDDVVIHAEQSRSKMPAEVSYGETIGTLKAICKSRALRRPSATVH